MSNPSDDDFPGMLALAKGIAEQRWPHTMDAREWAKKWVEQIKLTGRAKEMMDRSTRGKG